MNDRASDSQRRRRRKIRQLGAAQYDLCFYCDQPLEYPEPEIRYDNDDMNGEFVASIDHVIPRSKNGREGSNLIIAHRQCNSLRALNALTEEQSVKLAALNERRAHLFDESSGKTHPSTFGIISFASIVLAEKVDDPETSRLARRAICKFLQRYAEIMRSLKRIKNAGDWQYVSTVVLEDHTKKLNDGDFLYKTYVASVLKAIRQEQLMQRYDIPTWKELDYDHSTGI